MTHHRAGRPEQPRGLDVHGAEPMTHRFTITDADGNADVELNFAFPLTRKRHAEFEHLLEEGYTEHEAYVLLVGGEIVAHMQSIRDKQRARSGANELALGEGADRRAR